MSGKVAGPSKHSPDAAGPERRAPQAHRMLRAPDGYALGREALSELEAAQTWPIPLNYELWTHALAHPGGSLAKALSDLLASGAALTEEASEQLAATHLPQHRASSLISQAGGVIDEEIGRMTSAIASAHSSTEEYAHSLQQAVARLAAITSPAELRQVSGELISRTESAGRQIRALSSNLVQSQAELKKLWSALEKAEKDARTDELTLLPNRKAFNEKLGRALQRAASSNAPLTVAIVDIDHFKRFNDKWGHQIGDQVLRYAGKMISEAVAKPRFAARYGGEEFAILLPGEGGAAMVELLESLRGEMAHRQLQKRSTGEVLDKVTISSGFAQWRTSETAATLMDRADKGLYRSKRDGRNRITDAATIPSLAA